MDPQRPACMRAMCAGGIMQWVGVPSVFASAGHDACHRIRAQKIITRLSS